MGLSPSTALAAIVSRTSSAKFLSTSATSLALLAYLQLPDLFAETKDNMYNVLWVLVFGFATLNILGLAFRRFDTRKMGLSFGEILAILVVILSLVLFGLEMLGVLNLFPIHLAPR
jgi:hypothetical protein